MPQAAPVSGLNNVFNRQYVSSIVANASEGKYSEPSPGRTWFAGLSVEMPLL